MSKFNRTTPTKKEENYSGFRGFKRSDFKKEISSIILNSMLKGDSYYESESDRIDKVFEMIAQNPEESKFLAKLLVYTRNVADLRSISHVAGVALVENVKGKSYVRKALYKAMVRPDDALEMVALWNARHEGKMIPNALRRAIKQALEERWDAYQLRKYYGNGPVKVSNLIMLSHPKPKNKEQKEMFKQALSGKKHLPKIETAQTINASKSGEERGKAYIENIRNGKLGYMALLKNIAKITEYIDSYSKSREDLDIVVKALKNERAIRGSRILPFRILQAYEAIEPVGYRDVFIKKDILNALEKAFVISAGNVSLTKENERVALMIDSSGSMHGDPFRNALTLSASFIAKSKDASIVGWFWDEAVREIVIPGSNFLKWIDGQTPRGYGTQLSLAVSTLLKNEVFVDKIVIFTDMQENTVNRYDIEGDFNHELKKYRKNINPDVKVLFWNIEGYGGAAPVSFKNEKDLEVSGFSFKLLDVVSKMWDNPDALIEEIESIEL